MDELTRVYEKYKHMDKYFMRCATWGGEADDPFTAMGEFWVAIKKEIEMGDDGK